MELEERKLSLGEEKFVEEKDEKRRRLDAELAERKANSKLMEQQQQCMQVLITHILSQQKYFFPLYKFTVTYYMK